MKVLLIATCLALASIFVVDGASVPLAAVGSTPESSAISREELSHSISELASRAALSNIVTPAALELRRPPEINCSGSFQPAIDALKFFEDTVRAIPDVGSYLVSVVEPLVKALAGLLEVGEQEDISYVLDILQSALAAIVKCVRQAVPEDPANPGTKNALASPQEM
ncbi:hypothetical protein DFQ26_009467 [Actinomortierella ambigua]|nr:hypothetical protein DFQ26_009467 [Actinomortierella ambigua]